MILMGYVRVEHPEHTTLVYFQDPNYIPEPSIFDSAIKSIVKQNPTQICIFVSDIDTMSVKKWQIEEILDITHHKVATFIFVSDVLNIDQEVPHPIALFSDMYVLVLEAHNTSPIKEIEKIVEKLMAKLYFPPPDAQFLVLLFDYSPPLDADFQRLFMELEI